MKLFLILCNKSLICKLSLWPGVQLLAMICADHQGAVQNMAGIVDIVLAVGSSRGAARPSGPQREGAAAVWWRRWASSTRPRQVQARSILNGPEDSNQRQWWGWGRHPAPRHWGSQAGTHDSGEGGVHWGLGPWVLPRAQRSAGTFPSSPDPHALITNQT